MMSTSNTSKATPRTKLSPVKLTPPPSNAMSTPTRPPGAMLKTKNNVLETGIPISTNVLSSQLEALSITQSPSTSPTKRVYHSPLKENQRPAGDKLQINLRPPEDDSPGMSEAAKKSLRSINALRGLTIDEIEVINKPHVKRLATVTQLYFIDHYFDLLTYLADRKRRLESFKASHPVPAEGKYTNTRSATAWKDYCGRERANLRKRRTKTKCNDFSILSQIGQGGYGQVFLARKRDTAEIVALKKMNKGLLHKMDEIRHILVERDILAGSRGAGGWLVQLLYAFQDEESIYLAMEYVPGGDFRSLINASGILHNEHARFYSAEMFLAVNALHKLGYIHRDLKPENFLVSANGHIKLTDFGLSSGILAGERIESMRLKLDAVSGAIGDWGAGRRSVKDRRRDYKTLRENNPTYAKSVVGSPDYMAPEVLHGTPYDHTVDYWSLGCMLFETLVGYPPFAGKTPDETWANLRHWKKVLARPVFDKGSGDEEFNMQDSAWNFLMRTITERKDRYQTIEEVQCDPYFTMFIDQYAPIDWERIRQISPPFVPELESEEDVGYFDDFSNEDDMAKYKEVYEKQLELSNLADRDAPMKKSAFVGFTFRHMKGVMEKEKARGRQQQRGRADGTFGTMF